MKKDIVNEISKELWNKFALECEIEGQYIKINEFYNITKNLKSYSPVCPIIS